VSAIIKVISGPQAGEELWIEYEVSRLGGDAGCELHLAGAEPHALTLRYSDGRYNVYNRGSQPVTLDGSSVDVGQAGIWRSGRDLKLGDGTVLRMAIEGDGAPSRRPEEAAVEPRADVDIMAVEGGPTTDEAPKKKSNNLQLVAVIALFAGAALVLFAGGDGEDEAALPKKSFDEVAVVLRQEQNLPPDLWLMFNAAHVAEYRGREEEAKQAFERLRDRVEWEKNVLLAEKKPVPASLIDAGRYIADRLSGESEL
jgi:hypothetical protein